MQKYESVLIARQDLGASQVNNIVSNLSEVIKKEGGEVVREDPGLPHQEKPQRSLRYHEHFRSGQRHCRVRKNHAL